MRQEWRFLIDDIFLCRRYRLLYRFFPFNLFEICDFSFSERLFLGYFFIFYWKIGMRMQAIMSFYPFIFFTTFILTGNPCSFIWEYFFIYMQLSGFSSYIVCSCPFLDHRRIGLLIVLMWVGDLFSIVYLMFFKEGVMTVCFIFPRLSVSPLHGNEL